MDDADHLDAAGQQAIERAGITADQLAAFIPHQANIRIIDELAKQLKLPESVAIARDIVTTGNTSAASIPLAAHALLAEKPELSGGLALLAAIFVSNLPESLVGGASMRE